MVEDSTQCPIPAAPHENGNMFGYDVISSMVGLKAVHVRFSFALKIA
jgi:hypothetical protein